MTVTRACPSVRPVVALVVTLVLAALALGTASMPARAADPPATIDRTIGTDGSPTRLDLGSPGQRAVIHFPADAGRRYTLRWVPHGFADPSGIGTITAGNGGGASTFGFNGLPHWALWPADGDGTTDVAFDPAGAEVGSVDVSVELVAADLVVTPPQASWFVSFGLSSGQRARITWPTTTGRRYVLAWVPHGFATWGWIDAPGIDRTVVGYNDEVHARTLVASGSSSTIVITPTVLSRGTFDLRVTEVP